MGDIRMFLKQDLNLTWANNGANVVGRSLGESTPKL